MSDDWRNCYELAIDQAIGVGRMPGPERLVYADKFSEWGDEEMAACHRWMAAEEKTPHHLPTGIPKDGQYVGWNWIPVSDDIFVDAFWPKACRIVVRQSNWAATFHEAFPTRQAAERALADWLAAPKSLTQTV